MHATPADPLLDVLREMLALMRPGDRLTRDHCRYAAMICRLPADVGGCWLWQGCDCSSGHGMVYRGGNSTTAHRGLWQLVFGVQLPRWIQLHHVCRRPLCVRPDHVEPIDGPAHAALTHGLLTRSRRPRRRRTA